MLLQLVTAQNINFLKFLFFFLQIFASQLHHNWNCLQNYKRVAEVWMDEYAEFLYKRRPHYRQLEAGDLATQKQLRKELNCKPFKWFMREIAFDLVSVYPPVEPPDYANGKVRDEWVGYFFFCKRFFFSFFFFFWWAFFFFFWWAFFFFFLWAIFFFFFFFFLKQY